MFLTNANQLNDATSLSSWQQFPLSRALQTGGS
jgi:hypothetical protein